MNQREKFSSRLGFILISAGCAIGLGNVYRFPIMTGAYGGALFVLIYIAFLLLMGLPIMTMELSVGRGSQRSIASSFDVLEKPGQKWHFLKYTGMAGNYILMMFYTIISAWMVIYFFKYVSGSIFRYVNPETLEAVFGASASRFADGSILKHTSAEELGNVFGGVVSNTPLLIICTFAVILICFGICSLGLQKGVEKITKYMMIALFVLMIALAAYSCTLGNAAEGLKFYLIPSFDSLKNVDIMTVISAAMGQSFFTLSIGIGSIAIFGSYIKKDRSLMGEAVTITALDTLVALTSGFIIFPACFTFAGGVNADASSVGASFLFTTLSGIFNSMGAVTGRIIGTLFFIFMIFAAYSTVIAVFENIISFWLEMTNIKRPIVCFINIGLIMVLSLPAILSLGLWENIKVLGMGFLDLEDFIVSNFLLPVGSMVYVIFCTCRYGWGWKNFEAEVNTGNGLKFPKWLRYYMTFGLPLIILFLMVFSIVSKF